MRMRFISLCSGIEAASVAFKSLGWDAIAFSEIDAFPSAVLAHHYPSAWQDARGEWWSPDYTLIPFGARKKISKSKFAYLRQTNPGLRMEDAEKLAADGLRYKALGNSWAIPCVSWIGKRIKAAL